MKPTKQTKKCKKRVFAINIYTRNMEKKKRYGLWKTDFINLNEFPPCYCYW